MRCIDLVIDVHCGGRAELAAALRLRCGLDSETGEPVPVREVERRTGVARSTISAAERRLRAVLNDSCRRLGVEPARLLETLV